MEEIKYFNDIEEFILENQNSTKDYLLFVTQNSKVDIGLFKDIGFNIYGAIFPDIIFESKLYKTGVVSFPLDSNNRVLLEKSLQNPTFTNEYFKDVKSIITIVDGFAKKIESFLENLFEKLEDNTQIIGGGAGNLDSPVIFDKYGMYNDCSLLICKQRTINIGVKHGWKAMKGPFVVTSSNQNILQKIDYKNAFEVYKKIVEKDSGKKITKDNFLDISKSYPIGIVKYTGEVVVRDPFMVEDGDIVVVGDIPVNSIIYILTGNKKTLIKSASKASKVALKYSDCEFERVLVFDCKSREMYLDNEFNFELNAISNELNKKPLYGAITIGEIANNSDAYVTFYNKTCVVGLLC